MAKQERKKSNDDYKNMPDGFKNLVSDIKKDKLKNVILICGKEQYLVKWAVNEIVKLYVNKGSEALDFTKLTDKDFKLNKIVEAGDTISMLSPKRVVLVEDFYYAEGRTKRKKKEDGDTSEDDAFSGPTLDSKEGMDALCEYVKTVSGNTLLIFTCEIPSGKAEIYKAISDCGSIYVLKTLGNTDLKHFIEKKINAAGKSIKGEVMQEIIDLSGYSDKESDYTLYNLENDINKIIAHAKYEYIIREDVINGINGNQETGVFPLIDAIMSGNKDNSFKILYNTIGMEADGAVLSLLPQIVRTFELILFAKELKDENKTLAEGAAELGYPPTYYPLKKAWSYADNFSIKRLKSICKAAYEVESNFKKGLLSDTLAMEMFIAKI